MTDAQKQAFLSSTRSLAMLFCGIAIGRGWITTEQAEVLAGAAVAVVPALWGIWRAFHAENNITVAVQAGVAMGQNTSVRNIDPLAITAESAKAIIAVHAPEEKP